MLNSLAVPTLYTRPNTPSRSTAKIASAQSSTDDTHACTTAARQAEHHLTHCVASISTDSGPPASSLQNQGPRCTIAPNRKARLVSPLPWMVMRLPVCIKHDWLFRGHIDTRKQHATPSVWAPSRHAGFS
jgi:hypothetical protein